MRSVDEPFLVDCRGQPAVIIMSIKDYIDTIAPTPKWLEQTGTEAKRKGLNKLTMRQINAENPSCPSRAPSQGSSN